MSYLKNMKKNYLTLLLDKQNEVNKLFKIEILPTAIFLDKNLVVKRVYPGRISKQQTLLFQYIDYLLDCKEKESVVKKEKKMRAVMVAFALLHRDIKIN